MSGDQETTNPASPNPHAAQADPIANAFITGGKCPVTNVPAGPGVAVYDSAPLSAPATMIGPTQLSVDYDATTADGLQLDSRMYDVFPDGRAVMVDRGVRRVTSAGGTQTYELDGNGWRFAAGHRIRIEVDQDEGQYVKRSVISSSAVIHGVRLSVPVREPQRDNFPNAAKFCEAQRDFLGEAAFGDRYGTNRNKANAFGKCVNENN
jgi:predicted acyl esterase